MQGFSYSMTLCEAIQGYSPFVLSQFLLLFFFLCHILSDSNCIEEDKWTFVETCLNMGNGRWKAMQAMIARPVQRTKFASETMTHSTLFNLFPF